MPPPDAGSLLDASQDAPDSGPEDLGIADSGVTDAGGPEDTGPDGLDCSASKTREISTDTSTAGPWPVGARTATIANLPVEVWYPARPGSEAGRPRVRYDIREHIPASERSKIPDQLNPWQDGDAYRDLPLDVDHGPYPVILFVHGTASFRTQSLAQVTHWASRGFVVLSADHPGLRLLHLLGLACGTTPPQANLRRDLRALLDALEAPRDDISFLEGHIDLTRVGMAGHSAGGNAIAEQGASAAVLVPLAAGGTMGGAALRRTLVMGADADQVVPYENTVRGFESSPTPGHFVGISNAGHLAFSSLCSLRNANGQNLLEIGTERGICGVGLAGRLFDCEESYLDDLASWEIIKDATAAVFESELWCRPEALERLDTLPDRYGSDIADIRTSGP